MGCLASLRFDVDLKQETYLQPGADGGKVLLDLDCRDMSLFHF
jgi:hypothetical protein